MGIEFGGDTVSKIHAEIDLCRLCERRGQSILKPASVDRGNGSAEVFLIGLAPGQAVVDAGVAFAGRSFTNLLGWFREAGFQGDEAALRAKLYLTSILKCGANPDLASSRKTMWGSCQPFLWRQIDAVCPQLIIMLGKETAEAVLPQEIQERDAVQFGGMFSFEELYGQDLFPPIQAKSKWLLMPHPSGLSRTMNDQLARSELIAKLRSALEEAGFFNGEGR